MNKRQDTMARPALTTTKENDPPMGYAEEMEDIRLDNIRDTHRPAQPVANTNNAQPPQRPQSEPCHQTRMIFTNLAPTRAVTEPSHQTHQSPQSTKGSST